MHRLLKAATAFFVGLWLCVPVFAEGGEGATASVWEQIKPFVRALGFFLLMMAIIYGLLRLTSVLGKRKDKH